MRQDALDCMIVKTELYFRKIDAKAEDQVRCLFSLFDENLVQSEYLQVIEVIDRLLNLAPTGFLTDCLLDEQEKVIEKIPNNFYSDGELDEWRLRNAVNRHHFFLMNGDERAYDYYNRAVNLCKKNTKEKQRLVICRNTKVISCSLALF